MKDGALALHGGVPTRDKFLPYARQSISEADIAAVARVLRSDFLTTGPEVSGLESKLCEITGAKYAAAVSNGTAALHLACMALGIGEGDEVIVSSITFAASSNCVLYCGGTPMFADISTDTWNLDPRSVERLITSRTKAVVAVDFTGRPAVTDELSALCKKRGIALIEDAAHSLGSSYRGRSVGQLADITTLSFHPVKTVTAGEGGAVLCGDRELHERVLLLRGHGITRDGEKLYNKENGDWYYEQQLLGYNYRISDFQCALCASQLDRLGLFADKRRELTRFYDAEFSGSELLSLPAEDEDCDTVRHLYPICLQTAKLRADRREIYAALKAENIGVNVHYIPVYLMPFYRSLGYERGLCPNAEALHNGLITLPLFYDMSIQDARDVVTAVKKILNFYAI